MLDDLFGETGGTIAEFVLALFVVLVLIIIVAWLLKKLLGSRFGATHSGQAELEIIDTLAIDPKRRLVLVRHGKLEHLLLIGGGSDEVVERSLIGGLPITARVQASKPQAAAPEKAPEPPARPSSKFLDRLERTNAARKSKAAKDKADDATPSVGTAEPDSNTTDQAAPSGTSTATSAATASTVAAGSAYATMLATTNQSESAPSTSGAPGEPAASPPPSAPSTENVPKPASTAQPAPSTQPAPPPIAEPAPIDLPPLPKATSSPTAEPPMPLPKSEREALEQSLDAALHDSLLTPEAPTAPEPPKASELPPVPTPPLPALNIADETKAAETPQTPASETDAQTSGATDFKLFDDGELEREMEAALADTSAPPTPTPQLDVQSTAAIEAELAIDLNEPKAETPEMSVSTPAETSSDAATATSSATSAPNETADTKPVDQDASSSESDGETDAEKSEPDDGLPPLKDIPVELSRPDPVAVQIPSRGPAANATSVTKADNGISGEIPAQTPEAPIATPADQTPLPETPASDEQAAPESSAKPASGGSSDLDEEMRRLLGEIAGDPKNN